MFTFLKMQVTHFSFDFPEKELERLEGNCNVSIGIGIPENDPNAPVKCKIEVMFKSRNEDEFLLNIVAIYYFKSDAPCSNDSDFFNSVDTECTPIALNKMEELISNLTEQFCGIPITFPLKRHKGV